MSEVVTDNVARLVAWVLVMPHVLVVAVVCYKHNHCVKTVAVCMHCRESDSDRRKTVNKQITN